MKRTPMQRTARLRASSTTADAERNRAERLAARAQRAIKNAPACDSVQVGSKSGPAHVSNGRAAIESVARRSTTAARPRPKPKAHRNAHLRDMARGMPCLLQIRGVCTHDRDTVVCCHSNLSIHGKAGARKADDHYSAWGCAACHQWLDQGTAPRAQKYGAFMAAHVRQVDAWRAIAYAPDSERRDRAAALWALERLNCMPNLPAALEEKAPAAINSGVE